VLDFTAVVEVSNVLYLNSFVDQLAEAAN